MPGDEHTTKGPRHAAPRKSLLTRLPGGKIAFAAMPSALLLGIGLTPQLAQAQPGGQNPFRDGPCVSVPDKELDADGADGEKKSDGDKSDGEKKSDTEKGGDKDGDSSGDEKSDGEKPGNEPSTPDAKPTPDKPDSTPDKPEPEPEPSESRHPLDPLGVGEKLRDLFNPDKDKDADEEKAEDAKPSEESTDDGVSSGKDKDAKDAEASPAEEAESAQGQSAKEKAESAKEEAAEKAEAAKEKAEKKKAAKEKAEKDAEAEPDADGKKPFPCPEFDKEAFDDAENEETPVLVPDEPFTLNTTRLGLGGLKYHGIIKVTTHGGTEKRVLKFTADQIDIKDLHQVVVGSGGKTQHIRSQEGSTSTFRDGTVTMYTEELKGKLFGLIPISFSPESPPPLDIPAAVFTDAEVTQAGQFGGTLKVPGLTLGIE